VAGLRQVDVQGSRGQRVADAVRAMGGTEVTGDRWRREYGGLNSDQVRRRKALESESRRLRQAGAGLTLDKLILAEAARGVKGVPDAARWTGSALSPAWAPRLCRAHQAEAGGLRAPCLARPRSASLDTSRKAPRGRDDEEALTADIIALAREGGRCGHRRITALLGAAGGVGNAKRVERIRRRDGLKVPRKQPNKGRLRLRPERPSLGLRLRRGPDAGRAQVPQAQRGGRGHPRGPGPPSGPHAQGRGRDRRAVRPVHPAGRARPCSLGQRPRVRGPRRGRTGSRPGAPRPPASSRAHLGRTALSRASAPASATGS
jgi:hypothetical protein